MAKKLLTIAILVVLVVVASTPVFADVDLDFPEGGKEGIESIDTTAKKIWKTVTDVVQILAFAAIVFAGLRYMFASADQKADIKKSLGMLTVGAILVFAASTVVKFVVGIGGDLLKIQ